MPPKAGNQELRKGRVSVPGHVYLVTFVTQGRRRVFTDFECGRVAARLLSKDRYWLGASVLCWVLMPDHWHGMVQITQGQEISHCVNRAKAVTAIQCNKLLKRRGRFWQKAFHDHALRREEDFQDVARYIVANPLRAGLVTSLRDYPFWDAIWL